MHLLIRRKMILITVFLYFDYFAKLIKMIMPGDCAPGLLLLQIRNCV